MSTPSTHRSLHPMQWVAAIAVTVFAITGIGAITGLIPVAKSQTDAQPAPQPIAAEVPAAPVAPVAAVPAPAPAPQVVVNTAPAPVKHHHRPTTLASNDMPPPPGAVPPDYKPQPAPICNDCGRIESVQRITHDGNGSGVGAVAGGVLGGALGNGVGQGNGRVLTTIAGAIGGAFLGNHVEKSNKQTVTYQTTVRFDDGSSRVFNNANEPGWREGERIHLVNGELQPG